MTKTASIHKEVSSFISKRIEAGEVVRIAYLSTEFLAQKGKARGKNADFYTMCAHHHIRDIAKTCIGKFKPKETTVTDVALPGFEHLQSAYTVERKGERLLVPVALLTDDELEARAVEYESMASGCTRHANEIRTYISQRSEREISS